MSAGASAPATVGTEAPARERKVATLLFADVVGFTELGEQAAVADIGYEPLLGPLPETRWVGVGMVAT